ncbi:hypothetical protein JAAARDRAFT_33082 [Jaapia argillacea MUCL 33604]|uniref:Uncharacterized protein n=1 Tax=Jaapia argillacea MUCL 33604 TaxID=933084 RepID=A0A067QAA0_9AGAM|nr:hypothetical protein JAAARDRAFT_33082 [Jaapia argillacea MUCL 33604]
MSNSVLASFDPFAVHPFTNSSGLMAPPPPPSQFPRHPPSPPQHATEGAHSTAPTSPPVSPSSSPIPPATIHAPRPRRANSPPQVSSTSPPKAIFVPFRPERSSPDLGDILVKKKVTYWGSTKKSADEAAARAGQKA